MAALCRRYGVQRRIGYKWVRRYRQEGLKGLEDRSRAPLDQAHRSSPQTVERVLEIRRDHPLWGAPKIRARLRDDEPQRKPPAASTIGEILRHEGLTNRGKKRRRTPPYNQPLAHADGPNEVLSIDFKGWFRARNGERVDPLTLLDNHSRYLLCCQALDSCDFEHVQAVLATVFREYGLPKRIRSDNGPPFASRAIAGLSRLSIWWTKLGIEVERIPPGTPSANGRQERFHRTLKQHTAQPPAATRRAQQRAFRRFAVSTTTSVRIKHWGNARRGVCIIPRRGRIAGSCLRSSIRRDICAAWSGNEEKCTGKGDGSSSAKSWPESRSGLKPSTTGSIGCGSRRSNSAALMCAKTESRRCPPGGTTAPAGPPPRPPPPPPQPNLTPS